MTLRIWIITILALLGGAGITLAAPADWEEANRLFDSGEYAAAQQRYEQLAARGERSANLFYNLGNTHFRLGATGRAVLFYERALAQEPAHPEAARNLAVARNQSGAKLKPQAWTDRLLAPWSVNAYMLITTVAVWAALFCVAAVFVWRGSRSRSWAFVLVVAFLAGGYAGCGTWRAMQQVETLAVITSKDAVARLQPAMTSGVAEPLPTGSRVEVLSERGDWIYCELPSGGRGWLPAGALEKVHAFPS